MHIFKQIISALLLSALTTDIALADQADPSIDASSTLTSCPKLKPRPYKDSDVAVRAVNLGSSRPSARLVLDGKWEVDIVEGVTFVKWRVLHQKAEYTVKVDKVAMDYVDVTAWQPEGECFYATKSRLSVGKSDE